MGFNPITAAVAMGAMSAANSMAQSGQQKAQQRAQADALRNQAALQRMEGEREAERIDRQKIKLTKQFNDLQAHNNVALGAGNVDAASGSADAVAEGNINRYAADLADNSYERALSIWSTNEKVKQTEAQADYYSRSASNVKDTILGGIFSGASGFLSGYSMAGGKIFGNATKDTAMSLWDAHKDVFHQAMKIVGK